jgi:hypothetical protein
MLMKIKQRGDRWRGVFGGGGILLLVLDFPVASLSSGRGRRGRTRLFPIPSRSMLAQHELDRSTEMCTEIASLEREGEEREL